MSRSGLALGLMLMSGCVIAPARGWAQPIRGTILDETGLPLPGATVQLLHEGRVLQVVASGPDGTFELDSSLPGAAVAASLEGVEPVSVTRHNAARLRLPV